MGASRCRFQEADAVPDLGLSRRDVRRLLELGKGTLDVALDLGAAHGARVEDLRVLRVDGAGPIEGPRIVSRRSSARASCAEKAAMRASPGKRFSAAPASAAAAARSSRKPVTKAWARAAVGSSGTKLGRSLRPCRIGERGRDVAAVDGRDPAPGIEAALGAREEGGGLAPAPRGARQKGLDEIGAGALRDRIEPVAPRLGERRGGGLASVEGERGLGKAEPVRHLARLRAAGPRSGPVPGAQRRPVEGRRRQRQ